MVASPLSRLAAAVAARPPLQVGLALLVVAALLSPSLLADFVWDDVSQIVESPTIGDWRSLPTYFAHNVVESRGGEGTNAEGIDLYRPLFMVALSAIYAVDGADSAVFHLAVLSAHLLVCFLLWRLAVRWLGSPAAALALVVVFALHPMIAEAYLWASAISEPLSVAALLTAVLVLDSGRGRTGAGWIAAGILLLGLLTKEAIAAALPALALFLWRVRGLRPSRLLPAALAVATYLGLRTAALGGLAATGASAGERLAALRALPILVLDGARALLVMRPIGVRHLSYDYQGLGWAASAAAALLVVAVAAVAWRARGRRPLFALAVALLVLMLAPVALVATVPGWGGFGRYLYLPAAFACLAAAESATPLIRRVAGRGRTARVALILAAGLYLGLQQTGLVQALRAYSNQEELARSAVRIQPEAPDGWEWLGNAYVERGELTAALDCYRRALERAPDRYGPRQNTAAALLYLGRPAEALAEALGVESRHGVTPESSLVVVRSLVALGRWPEAARRLLWIVERRPEHAGLLALQAELLARHPQPVAYREWLERELERPELAAAARALRPLLATPDSTDGR